MEFKELIRIRESIRNYDPDRSVGGKTLIKILEAGRLAPSAANKQPWKFIVVSSKEKLSKVKLCYEKTWFQDAPHILAVVGNKKNAWVRSYDNRCFIETDLAIAMDHLILAAEDEGVSTCWISNFKPEVLRNALRLQDYECVYAVTPLGYPRLNFTKKGVKERKTLEEIVSWE